MLGANLTVSLTDYDTQAKTMFLKKRHTETGDVKAGSVYQKSHSGEIVEVATVLSVGEDSSGIPHVRFKVCFERPNRKFLEDARVLALESFAQQYCQHATAA
jgi:hypothetical protein